LDSLKSTTVKSIALRQRRDETAWLRTLSTTPPDIADAFKEIIEQTSRHGGWDLVGQGDKMFSSSFFKQDCLHLLVFPLFALNS
jgi:hypothetical protein